jgi:hypothetical protein
MGFRWQFDGDRIARPDLAPGEDDSHDAGLSHDVSAHIASEHGCSKTGSESIELRARIPEPRHLDQRRIADLQPRPSGKVQKGDPARRDVSPMSPATTSKPA